MDLSGKVPRMGEKQPRSPIRPAQHGLSAADTGCLGAPALCSLWKEVILGRAESIQAPFSPVSDSKILKAFEWAVTLRAEAGVGMQPVL